MSLSSHLLFLPHLQVLKQKRLYEGQRDQLYNQQYNLEQTNFAVSSMQDSVHTVKAMAVGFRLLAACCDVFSTSTVQAAQLSVFFALQAAGKELSTVMKSKELRIENIEKMQDNMQDLLVRGARPRRVGSARVGRKSSVS